MRSALLLLAAIQLGANTARASYTIQWDNDEAVNRESGFSVERSSDGQNFSVVATLGATTASYTDTTSNSASSYWYRVRSFSAIGTVNYYSAYSSVITNTPVFTTEPPASVSATAFGSITLTAAAVGLPAPTYQWKFNGTPLTDGSGYSGSNTSTLTLSDLTVAESGSYTCVASNGYLPNATTTSTVLTVAAAPQTVTFAAIPPQVYSSGATVTLSATASSGLPVSYSSSNPSVATVSGNILTLTGFGSSVITASQPGNAAYAAAPNASQTLAITVGSQTITFGSLPTLLVGGPSYTLVATSSSGLPVSYSVSNPTIATVSGNVLSVGSAGGTLTVTASQAGNANFTAAPAVPQTLVVNQAPVFTMQPANLAAPAGSTPEMLVAVSAYPTATYQWQVSTNGGVAWSNCAGSPYQSPQTVGNHIGSVPASFNGYQFRCIATNSAASTASNAAVLTVETVPSITTQPANQNTSYGGTASFAVAATSVPPPTYQWQISTAAGGSTYVNLANGGSYSGVTTATLDIANASTALNGFNYRCAVTNTIATTDTNPAQLTVGSVAPQITAQPADQTVAAGGSVNFAASASGGPEPTYQWQVSTNGQTWTNLSATSVYSGVTTDTLALANVPASLNHDQYRLVATNSAGSATSSGGTLTVTTAAPANTAQPQNVLSAIGGTATFSAAYTGAPPPTLQWQVSSDGGHTWQNLSETSPYSGTQTATLTVANLTSSLNNDQYRCVATNSAGSLDSSAATLTLGSAPPVISADPDSVTVSDGASASFAATVQSTTSVTCQWQISTDGGNAWSNLQNVGIFSGVTTASLTLSTTTAAINNDQFRLAATNSSGTTASNGATLTVLTTAPVFSQQPSARNIQTNSTTGFVVAAAGLPAPLFQWQVSTNGGATWTPLADGSPYSGTQTTTLVVGPATAAMSGNQYQCQAFNEGGAVVSSAATLTVSASASAGTGFLAPNRTQTILFAPVGAVSPGTAATLTATASSGLPVTFTVLSGNAVITGGNLLVVNDNQPVVIEATQSGNNTFYGAIPAQQTIGGSGLHTYFGSLNSASASSVRGGPTAKASSGSFAAVLNAGGSSGTLIGSLGNPSLAFIMNFTAIGGTFSGPVASLNPDGTTGQTLTITGSVNSGIISGTISPLGLAFSANADATGGSSSDIAGFYPGNSIYSVVGGQSQVFVLAIAGGAVSSGSGSVNGGAFSVQTSNGTTVTASVNSAAQTIAGASTAATNGGSDTFVGSLSAAAPTVTPLNSAANAGDTVTLSTPAVAGASYQWQYYGADLAGATGSTLNLRNIGAYQGGLYTVVVTSGGLAATSAGASVTVSQSARLINLSANGDAGTTPGTGLDAGFVISGAGSKNLLIRGDGPALAAFGVTGAVTDALLTFYDGTAAAIASDNGWGNAPVAGASTVGATSVAATSADFSSVFAFPLTAGSLDSALKTQAPHGSYTAEVTAAGRSASGTAILEVYDLDASSSAAFLTNISCRAPVSSGHTLTAGFVIGGSSSQTVLIRAVGPTLGSFGVTGVLPNPRLTLYDGSTNHLPIATNAGWTRASSLGSSTVPAGISAASAPLMTSVYAFALQGGSADSAIIATLPPGSYTAVIDSPTGASGTALVEIYNLP